MNHWKVLAGATLLSIGLTGVSAQADTLRLGTEGAYPPYNFTDASGNLVGFEIDLGNALCERMGVTCEWVAQDWDGIIPALLQGRYDAIIAGMSITDERRERIAFTQGYVTTPAVLVAAADSSLQSLETLEEVAAALDGRPVGVQSATIHQNFMEQELPGVALRLYDTQELLNLDLIAGRVDAGLADLSGWEPFLESDEGAGYAVFGPGLTGADYPIFGEGVGIGLRQDDEDLRDAFNAALSAMKEDGSLAALATLWFGYDTSLP